MSISLVNMNMDKILVCRLCVFHQLLRFDEVLVHGKATEMVMKALGFFQILCHEIYLLILQLGPYPSRFKELS